MRIAVALLFGLASVAALAAAARAAGDPPPQNSPGATLPVYGYRVVHTYPHDRDAFTEGLQFLDGFIYESTGLNGRSSIRKVRLETGDVLQRIDIDQKYFGEGLTVIGPEIFVLTWQAGIGFVYDRETFKQKRTFMYPGEGWALTKDANGLIMSDGTDTLRFIEPQTFRETRRLKVTAAGAPLKNVNELELVKGEIFANVWTTDRIARIDPRTGRVTGWVDLAGLLSPREKAAADVLNGIAYDQAGDRLFVTGKLWPKLFEIALVRKAG